MNGKYINQEGFIRFYINMYAFCIQRAYIEPEYKAHFLQQAAMYEEYYLKLSAPITLNEILSP